MFGEHRNLKTFLWNRGVKAVEFKDGKRRDKESSLGNIGTGKKYLEYRHCKLNEYVTWDSPYEGSWFDTKLPDFI